VFVENMCNEAHNEFSSFFWPMICLSLSSGRECAHHIMVAHTHTTHNASEPRERTTSPTDTLVLHPDDRLFLVFRRFAVFVIFTVCNRKDCHMFCQLCSLNIEPASLSDTPISSYSYIIHCVGDCVQALDLLYVSNIIGTSVRLW
jgi:hypothetical protein